MRTGWNKSWQTCWKQSLTPGLEGAYNGRGWTVGWLFFLPKRSFHCATLATCVPPCRHDQIVADHPPIHDFQRCSFIYSFSLYYRTSQPLREISSLRMNRPFSMGKIIRRRKKTYFILSFFSWEFVFLLTDLLIHSDEHHKVYCNDIKEILTKNEIP